MANAPLVALVQADPTQMNREELEVYLTKLRSLRASPQTTRAKTERKPKKNGPSESVLDDICG